MSSSSSLKSLLGSVLSPLLVHTSFWVIKRADGTFLSERDWVRDGNRVDDPRYQAGQRPFDWTLDVAATGDTKRTDKKRITELWLMCPPNPGNPLGQTARLPIVEPGTAFQFKQAFLDAGVGGSVRPHSGKCAQIIGRVDDKATGHCTCFIYDEEWQALSEPWHSNVYRFGSWRPEVAPLGALSHEVLGLSLA